MNAHIEKILQEVGKVIVGKEATLEKILMTVLSRGHVLLDDVPGTGKTTTALAFSRALGLQYGRIQFTPDVLPSDIVGFSLYRKESGAFVYQPGAVMTNLLLADEINRATPRTQSSLLECMAESVVTVDGKAHVLPKPFFVVATQNPEDYHGTYPLPEPQRAFLAVMGLADEFTVEMAQCVTGNGDAGQILSALTEQNAFVTRLPDGVTYRFHHMMKECAERSFQAMPAETQQRYWERFGLWYEQHRQYLHALAAYRKSGNYDALLRVIRSDAGILLASLKPEDVLEALDKCPAETLKADPFAVLVLMRRMFTWRQIPKMLELKALLLTAIEEHPEMPEEERGNLLGECDLILSFLCYNDISAMSRLHRSASSRMSRPAISIQSGGGWTFGSPSVLMMFYRAPGELESELAEMDECMPHYYRVTNHHGQGAETIMRAEALFYQGHVTDAHIELERAYAQVGGNGQINMALCCDFLSWRLSLHTDVERRYTFSERYAALLRYHDASWINIWSATSAYYHALRGETDKIPEIFSQHRLSDIHLLAPGKPMMEMIENQVYLAQGAYAKVIGHSAQLLAVCEAMHYALVALHIRIQTAAAYEHLGKREEARAWLGKALSGAAPDGLVMPFVENYAHLKPLLAQELKTDLIAKITELGEGAGARNAASARPAVFDALTPREFEIVELMAQRLSNREIAEKLYLSEGSVKQYVNQIYSKLHMEGDTRTKRKRLAELFGQKT